MTPIVRVQVIENQVVSPMTAAADICLNLESHGKVIIDLMSEAPCIATCELQVLFDFLGARGYDLSNIQVLTGNMVEQSSQVNVIHRSDFMYELEDYQITAKNSHFENKQIRWHFGHLNSRCNLPRLLIASFLFDQYHEQTFQTFHWRHNDDYHKAHLPLNELVYLYGANSVEAQQAWKLLQNSPLLKETVSDYPIILREQSDILKNCKWYKFFFVDIVCETRHDDRNFFLTEKFWRAVMTRTPFILHGPQWALENLRLLGFQTFSDWWDEGYSQDPGLHRVVEIKKVLQYLATKPINELEKIYQDMKPILEHNFQRFLELEFDDLQKVTWPCHGAV